MDLDQLIAAHHAWKQKLAAYLSKRDGSLNPVDVSSDKQCQLGQWIYGKGMKHSKLPAYSTLKSEHARFHVAAAEVVRRAHSGQPVNEQIALGAQSEFAKASSALVFAILDLREYISK
jgi:methyl-accepting chemotaxis protein